MSKSNAAVELWADIRIAPQKDHLAGSHLVARLRDCRILNLVWRALVVSLAYLVRRVGEKTIEWNTEPQSPRSYPFGIIDGDLMTMLGSVLKAEICMALSDTQISPNDTQCLFKGREKELWVVNHGYWYLTVKMISCSRPKLVWDHTSRGQMHGDYAA